MNGSIRPISRYYEQIVRKTIAIHRCPVACKMLWCAHFNQLAKKRGQVCDWICARFGNFIVVLMRKLQNTVSYVDSIVDASLRDGGETGLIYQSDVDVGFSQLNATVRGRSGPLIVHCAFICEIDRERAQTGR